MAREFNRKRCALTENAVCGSSRAAELEQAIAARRRAREQRSSGKKEPVLDSVVVPEELGPINVVVDDVKIKQFAFTQDDYGAWYFDTSPFGRRIGHASILANDLLQVYYTAYDRNRVVGLHTVEELEFIAPVFCGEEVTLTGRYVEKYERGGCGYVVMEACAYGDDGREIVRHRGVEIMRIGRGVVGSDKATRHRSGRMITDSCREDVQKVRCSDVGNVEGVGIVPLVKCVTSDQMAVYSYIGEFQKNIHNDQEIARSVGLDLPICQGQQEVCFMSELLTRFFGASWFTSGILKAKFIRPLPAESVIEIGGKVSHTEVTDEGIRQHVEVWIGGREKMLTAVGWASALLGCGS